MENNTNKICGDGSFMERFLKQKYSHKQKSTTIHTLSNEKKEETKIPTSPVLSKEEEEEKLKQELIQKQMDEIEEETRNRELMVKQLLNTQKEQKEKPDLPKNIPKARKQPFVSSSTPKVITGKRPTSTRSKPVMPVTKKQRVAIFLPRNRVPTAKIEIPKPPPLLIKKKIDSFANLVVEKGLNYEEEAMKENDRSYLFLHDKESEEYKYYEYIKEKLCEERGIILKNSIEESDSLKEMHKNFQHVSQKYKHLEDEICREEENKLQAEREAREYSITELSYEDKMKDDSFVKKLTSHLNGESEESPISTFQSPLMSNSSKGLKLLKNMGWTEGSGLGSRQTGNLEPISTQIKSDKIGLGMDGENDSDIFSEYKQRMREQYRNRPSPYQNPR